MIFCLNVPDFHFGKIITEGKLTENSGKQKDTGSDAEKLRILLGNHSNLITEV